jgi:hypothetical protein
MHAELSVALKSCGDEALVTQLRSTAGPGIRVAEREEVPPSRHFLLTLQFTTGVKSSGLVSATSSEPGVAGFALAYARSRRCAAVVNSPGLSLDNIARSHA